MRKVLLAVAAVSALAATPALANEGRVEARGGVIWFGNGGGSEDVWGVAAGYDFDLGSSAFAGLEASGDIVGATGSKVAFGFSGRLGTKLGENTKLFADGGYTTEPCTGCVDAIHAGVGAEVGFGKNLYGKLGYRHYFTSNGAPDSNAVVAGLGVKF